MYSIKLTDVKRDSLPAHDTKSLVSTKHVDTLGERISKLEYSSLLIEATTEYDFGLDDSLPDDMTARDFGRMCISDRLDTLNYIRNKIRDAELQRQYERDNKIMEGHYETNETHDGTHNTAGGDPAQQPRASSVDATKEQR